MKKSELQGVKELIETFDKMGVEIANDRLQSRIRNQAQVIINDAKSRVPVDSGDLRDSIGFINNKDSQYKTKVLIGLSQSHHNYYLGVMFEYGTAPRITKEGYDRGQIKPRPFMRPAIDKNREKVIQGIKKSFLDTLSEVAKKYGLSFK